MTDQVKEQLSAVVDSELPPEEQQLLVTRLVKDEGLARCWHRYHLIHDAIHKQLPEQLAIELLGRVRNALADDPPLSVSTGRRMAAWLRPLAGAAVAASVAVIAVIGVRNLPVETTPQTVVAGAAETPPAAAGGAEVVRVRGIRWNVDRPRVADQLNGYLVNHSEYAARSGAPGIGPHVRIVGYDTSR